MTESRDETLSGLLREFRRAPETPREALWAGIARARRHPRDNRRAIPWPLLVAASLALFAAGVATGVTLGTRRSAVDPAAMLPASLRAHLAAADSLITLVRLDATAVRSQPDVAVRARELLAATRVLEESSSVGAELGNVLRDLDLVLEQIAQYSAGTAVSPREGELIRDAITERKLPSTLRTMLDNDAGEPR